MTGPDLDPEDLVLPWSYVDGTVGLELKVSSYPYGRGAPGTGIQVTVTTPGGGRAVAVRLPAPVALRLALVLLGATAEIPATLDDDPVAARLGLTTGRPGGGTDWHYVRHRDGSVDMLPPLPSRYRALLQGEAAVGKDDPMSQELIHTVGDLVVVMADGGRPRAYEVTADGSLLEQDPGTATALASARQTGTAADEESG